MSAVSNDFLEIVGTVEKNHITADGENHYCCRWKIKNVLYGSKEKNYKSPVFTIPDRDACKWYLSFKSHNAPSSYDDLTFIASLVLDRESDCKEAIAKFNLTDRSSEQQCSLKSYKIFNFVTKSENRADIAISCVERYLPYDSGHKFIIIDCDIMIETVIPEDNSFPTDFGFLLKNQLFADVVLSVRGKKFPAHKSILATRSSVFAAMFTSNMVENRGVVHIKDMSRDTVEKMLHYIYTGEVEKLNDVAQDLLIAADKYDLKGLRMQCEGALMKKLSSENAFDLLLFAESYNANKLKLETINFIIRSTRLVKTSAWDHLSQSCPEPCRGLLEAVVRPKLTLPETKLNK